MKKNNLLILTDKISGKNKEIARQLKLNNPEINVILEDSNDIVFNINEKAIRATIGKYNLVDFKLVFFRRRGKEAGPIILYLEKYGVNFIDKGLKDTAVRGDKLTNHLRLAVAGINVIPTYYSSFKNLSKNISLLAKTFKFPLVAKDVYQHYLKGIFILNSEDDIKKLPRISDTRKIRRYLIQPFINFEHEYRLLVLGGVVRSVNSRPPRNFKKFKVDYLSQTEYETYVPLNKVNKEMKSLAIKAAKTLDLQVAGVDICVEKKTGQLYVIEVNRGPDFNYDQKISPEVPELIKYLKWKLKK